MSSKLIYQFRVTLLGGEPPIWRQIQVPAEYSFWDLRMLQSKILWGGLIITCTGSRMEATTRAQSYRNWIP